MKWKDQFRFVRQNMKKNRSRIFMTVLAAAMGCSFLIVLASVGFGLQKSVVSEVTEDSLLTEIEVYGRIEEGTYHELTREDVKWFESLEDVKSVTRRKGVSAEIESQVGDVTLTGSAVSVDFPSELNGTVELEAGGLPSDGDEIWVGYHFADQLIQQQQIDEIDELVGKPIQLVVFGEYTDDESEVREHTVFNLKVAGVLTKPSREYLQDHTIYLSESTLSAIDSYLISVSPEVELEEQSAVIENTAYDRVNIYADDVENVKHITKQLDDRSYSTYSIVNEMKEINSIFLIMKIGLIFVGTIAVIIASIGIYNTMTMAVTERTQEIGIMKAIGAHPRTIKRIFLIESGTIGLIGACIGTIVSYGISMAVNAAFPLMMREFLDTKPPEGLIFSDIPLSLTLICVGISFIVAVLSGMRPAVKATKIDVLKALRRDI
ncbi:ABC transporter permease [Marinicrinis lubricantis]|uniref:ABC transporter permease n=1 Tax=Marinicrinis lubricantis TaxID=2086470 RepID=A0ABW1IL67_9BACL